MKRFLRYVCPTFSFSTVFFWVSHIRPHAIHFPSFYQVKVKLLNLNVLNFEKFSISLKVFCPTFFFFEILKMFWYCLKVTSLTFLNLVIPQYNISLNFWNFEYFLNRLCPIFAFLKMFLVCCNCINTSKFVFLSLIMPQ